MSTMGPATMGTVLDAAAKSMRVSLARSSEGAPVRLFGQFLIDEGVLDEEDLSEALVLMHASNVTLGDLAVEKGLVTRHEAEEIARLQRCIDGRWGEIALTLGIGRITAEQLEELRWEQESQNLRLTDALVQLGYLSPTEVERLLLRFETEHASTVTARLPTGWQRSAAADLLDVLPRVFSRVLRSPVRFGHPRIWDGHSLDLSAQTQIETACEHLAAGLTVDTKVAQTISHCMRDRDIGLAAETGVASFVALLVDHVRRRLESEHLPFVEVHSPECGQVPRRGLAFDLALSAGQAILVIDRSEPTFI
jgi:hypothetical protein